ncbi:hypothetical protein ACFWWC_45915 [Streptomyces sp. NPDC058642]|uniref:hypothetical protein n=1 Tax=Streptomyces sp. NPDC058642 TaxID=3346572 RepID=UPI00365339E9
MRDIRRKFAVTALTAAAVLGGLALPTTASAADGVPAVQITICNDSNSNLRFWVKGYNQFNEWDDSPIWDGYAHTCATMWDYWWKKNSSVELHSQFGNGAWTWKQKYVPNTKGRTTTFHVS